MYAASTRPMPDGTEQLSLQLRFIMPTYCPPGVARPGHFSANIRVPIDNTSMMFFRLRWGLTPMTHEDMVEYKQGGYAYPEMIPGTWKTKANVFNDYEVDRLGQKTFLYSGIKTFPLQDIAMMENQWGPLAKRELEHLCAMDYHMIYLRRKLLKAAKAMRDGIETDRALRAADLALPQRQRHGEGRRCRRRNRRGEGACQDHRHPGQLRQGRGSSRRQHLADNVSQLKERRAV